MPATDTIPRLAAQLERATDRAVERARDLVDHLDADDTERMWSAAVDLHSWMASACATAEAVLGLARARAVLPRSEPPEPFSTTAPGR